MKIFIRDELLTVLGHVRHNYRGIFDHGFGHFAVGSIRYYVAKCVIRKLDGLFCDLLEMDFSKSYEDFVVSFLSIRTEYVKLYQVISAQHLLGLLDLKAIYSVPRKLNL